jgi:prepilin-type N-terminal cleavage/methylation domain-containing protein
MCYTVMKPNGGRGEVCMLKRGFSLVELLIVVGLLTLLATLAIPNFVEAQNRAKRSRVANDLAELSKSIESYYIDYRAYPATDNSLTGAGVNRNLTDASRFFRALPTFRNRAAGEELATLTTPVAYLPAYPNDIFAMSKAATFSYSTPDEFTLGDGIVERGWIAWSVGPGRADNLDSGGGYSGPIGLVNVGVAGQTRIASNFYNPRTFHPSPALINASYDPTNGTISPGVMWRSK